MKNNGRNWGRAIGIWLIVSIITGIFMIILFKLWIAPFPKPPSLAFAETLVGHNLPAPIGLLFHTMYVTLWSVIYIRFFKKRNFKMVLTLAFALWLILLFIMFPIVWWWVAGLNISPKLIPASFVPHLLFGLLLWLSDKYIPKKS